jgi:uncharacterized protein (DUF1015 family)
MATIKPFKGIRPAKEYVEDIAALPYDVYSKKEARDVVQGKPHTFLRVDRAETFFDEDFDTYSSEVYKKASETLYDMINKKLFVQDDKSCFYLYRLTMNGRPQTGLVTCTSIDEYLNNTIKKHELTREEKEKDRINHVDYCDANTGPIFLTYKSENTINDIIDNWVENNEPVYDFVADDNVSHTVWIIDNETTILELVNKFENIPALYIADGHHRAASAVKVGLKRREENKDYNGDEEFNYFLSVAFPDEQLYIMDYNRVVKDLNGLSESEFIAKVKEKFNVIQTSKEQIKPTDKATFGMFLNNKWYLLEAIDGTYNKQDPVLSLDVSILQLNLLSPILGIGDPRTDNRIDFVGGIRGLKELEKRSRNDMKVGFAMVPTSIKELMDIADANELMPPKSTWFEPKLRSGIFVHLLK